MKYLNNYKTFESSVSKSDIQECAETLMYSILDILDDVPEWSYTKSQYDDEYIKSGIKISNIENIDKCNEITRKLDNMIGDIESKVGFKIKIIAKEERDESCTIFIDIKWQTIGRKFKNIFTGGSDDTGPR